MLSLIVRTACILILKRALSSHERARIDCSEPSRCGNARLSRTGACVTDPTPFVKRLPDGTKLLDLSVTGAHCGRCIAKIENGLTVLPGIDAARLNLSTGRLSVTWRGDHLEPSAITAKISDLGFGATAFDPEAAQSEEDEEGRFLLRCLAVAGFAAANIMLLSIAVWAGQDGEMGPATRTMLHWVSAAIALPAAAFAGRPFFPLCGERTQSAARQYGCADFARGDPGPGFERLRNIQPWARRLF